MCCSSYSITLLSAITEPWIHTHSSFRRQLHPILHIDCLHPAHRSLHVGDTLLFSFDVQGGSHELDRNLPLCRQLFQRPQLGEKHTPAPSHNRSLDTLKRSYPERPRFPPACSIAHMHGCRFPGPRPENHTNIDGRAVTLSPRLRHRLRKPGLCCHRDRGPSSPSSPQQSDWTLFRPSGREQREQSFSDTIPV